MIEKKTIGYHYSLSLLLNQRQSPIALSPKPNIAFAPFSSESNSKSLQAWEPLPESANEIESKQVRLFKNVEASKDNFLKNYRNYAFIHLATHASVGNDSLQNWIQFYPLEEGNHAGRLMLPEIYNLNLSQTELITLSACETAAGVTLNGEGLLSLSRAFLYAGSNGVVSTLWKTDDRVSAYLMKRMYIYIESGESPAEALQLAKKDLLLDPKIGTPYKTPNYWANFIYTGSLPPASNQKTETNHYAWIGLFLLFCMLVFFNQLAKRMP